MVCRCNFYQKSNRIVKKKKLISFQKIGQKLIFEWMNNIQPWCISRQLLGHRIPAWYSNDKKIFVAENEEAKKIAKNITKKIV